jgi:hypothetical protein
MLTYPQLAQFPIVKRARRRTVINRAADGRSVKWADPAGETTEWGLHYSELSDDEAKALQDFFLAVEGTLQEFTFLDPTANLLAWSDKLDESVWLKGPLLTVSGGRLTNTGGGPQTLSQSIAGPAGYLYCFSAYVSAAEAIPVTMFAGSAVVESVATSEWRRLRMTAAVDDPTFGLEIPAGACVDVRGLQVEAQPGASAEQTSARGGVYVGARLRDDALTIEATGVNRNSCTVNIVHAIHI